MKETTCLETCNQLLEIGALRDNLVEEADAQERGKIYVIVAVYFFTHWPLTIFFLTMPYVRHEKFCAPCVFSVPLFFKHFDDCHLH